jgi:hypothetical protein
MRRHIVGWALPTVAALSLLHFVKAAPAPAPLYVQNFENLKEGEPPEEIQILDGEFAIKKIDNNMLLEMGPDPLKASGILFGPGDKNEYTVSARIKTAATGKRFPEFGLGSCGPNQFKLWMMPATGELQLLSGDDAVAKIPYKWESGTWTKFKLRVVKSGDNKFKIQGKAWADGKDEPKEWQISWEDPETPRPGRAGLFSTPYAGTPTDFDDIVVEPNSK